MTALTDYVDPFIGAEGGGNVFPGPMCPFGVVRLGPDCGARSSNSGYESNGPIQGFSHVHVSGAGGGSKYGNILLLPVSGDVPPWEGASERAEETASVGFYAVRLTRYGIGVEVSASPHVGYHRYSFAAGSDRRILVDVGSFLCADIAGEGQRLVGCEARVLSPTVVEGYSRVRGGWNKGAAYTVFFHAEFDTPAASWGTWCGRELCPGRSALIDSGTPGGLWLEYPRSSEPSGIQVRVGISFLGCGRAAASVAEETPHWDLDAVRERAVEAWETALAPVRVEGGSPSLKRTFYSALYHTMQMPTDRTGENPKWVSDEPCFDDFYAVWDTFRTSGPLLTLLHPEQQARIVRSMIDIYEHEGYMPEGRSGNDNGRTQGGSNCDVMVADAFVKGLTGIDYEKAYRGMLKNAEVPPGDDEQKQGRGGLPDYNSIGYVSTNFERSCTRTLEYAYCDFAIASLAQALGHDQDVDIYRECSANWQNLWRRVQHDGATGFVWPRRRDGTWVEDFDPLKTGSWEGVFYETHSWEYSFYVPHDVRQVMRLSGGADAFVRRLDTLFERGYYHVDNEPGFLCPVLYLWAGRHDKTAERVREITMRHYHDTRSGLPGNDDSGAVSAWFAFHAMGFFPNAGQDVYLISSPLFERTEILFPNGRSFTIEARGLSEANLYVSSAQLNGRDLDRAWFRHSEIADGGRLVLEMAPSPGDWGTRNPPPSVSDSAPELVQTGRIP